MQQGYLKITMKCNLNRMIILLSSYPIFNYGEFSDYAYITFIILCAMMKCKPKCFLHFLEKFFATTHNSPIPPPSQYIIDSFT